jgi:hypothetical protein
MFIQNEMDKNMNINKILNVNVNVNIFTRKTLILEIPKLCWSDKGIDLNTDIVSNLKSGQEAYCSSKIFSNIGLIYRMSDIRYCP